MVLELVCTGVHIDKFFSVLLEILYNFHYIDSSSQN